MVLTSSSPLDEVCCWASRCSVDLRDSRVARVDLRHDVGFSSVLACSWLLEVSERLFSGVRSCSEKSMPMMSSACSPVGWLWSGAAVREVADAPMEKMLSGPIVRQARLQRDYSAKPRRERLPGDRLTDFDGS